MEGSTFPTVGSAGILLSMVETACRSDTLYHLRMVCLHSGMHGTYKACRLGECGLRATYKVQE